jgi:hypothetical protein
MKQIISICGDVCSECPRYLATLANDHDELQRVAELWFQLGFRDKVVLPGEMRCNGCHTQKKCGYGLMGCENLAGLANCGECKLFPCEKFDAVFEKTEKGDELCKNRLNASEYAHFKRVFFMKKEILTTINHLKFKHQL